MKSVSDIAAIVKSLWKDFLAWRAIPEQYLNGGCEHSTLTESITPSARNNGGRKHGISLLDLTSGQKELQPVGVGELLLQRLKVFFADVLSKQVNRLKAGTKQSAK